MRLAVSNIAWERGDDHMVAGVLRAAGLSAVEVAPTRAWPDVRAADAEAARLEAQRWKRLGLDVIATQSLLYGRPDLLMFGDAAVRSRTVEHVAHVVTLGAEMGARAQVFGSPRNRRREALRSEEAFGIAVDVFEELAEVAERHGTVICIEANPPEYGADFLTSVDEAARLVVAVGRAGVRLQLDSACMLLAGDDISRCVAEHIDLVGHVHLSEPGLGPVGSATSQAHVEMLGSLFGGNYQGTVSVEMRPTATPVESVAKAVAYATRLLDG